LGWEPKVGFEELIAMMVDSDLVLESDAAAREGLLGPSPTATALAGPTVPAGRVEVPRDRTTAARVRS
ncbi:GDP-mannose 4,6-dehydratase, partial [Frankia sp. AgB32]|nr:GDP-mannose 4,6-dehydratase [Frankia sp. AgB32]